MSQKEIDHAIRTTFRNPPILASEDRALYEDLKRLVLSDIKPLGLQETLLARDIVEAEWEVCRLRWMKVAILHAVLPRVIKSLILEVRRHALPRSEFGAEDFQTRGGCCGRRSAGAATARKTARASQPDSRPHPRCGL